MTFNCAKKLGLKGNGNSKLPCNDKARWKRPALLQVHNLLGGPESVEHGGHKTPFYDMIPFHVLWWVGLQRARAEPNFRTKDVFGGNKWVLCRGTTGVGITEWEVNRGTAVIYRGFRLIFGKMLALRVKLPSRGPWEFDRRDAFAIYSNLLIRWSF